jgi:phosphate/phosphite/phosphonate ABC transporter binding protein
MRIAFVLLIMGTFVAGCAQQAGPAKSELVLSPPLGRTSEFMQMRAPAQQLADHMANESGIKISIFVPTDYGNTILGLKQGQLDIAYLPAGLYPRAVAEADVSPGVLVMVDGKTTESSGIYVKSGSNIGGLSDLRGKTVAAADPFSAAGWVMPAAELKGSGIDPVSDINVNFRAVDADALVEVLEDEADAALAVAAALESDAVAEAGGAGQLKAIKEFKDVPIGVIVFGNGVTGSQANKLKKALTGIAKSGAMGKDGEGNSVPLLGVFGWDGLKAAKEADLKTVHEKAVAIGMVPSK